MTWSTVPTAKIHANALTPDDVVLIADDLVTTGGTCVVVLNLPKAGAKSSWLCIAQALLSAPKEIIGKC